MADMYKFNAKSTQLKGFIIVEGEPVVQVYNFKGHLTQAKATQRARKINDTFAPAEDVVLIEEKREIPYTDLIANSQAVGSVEVAD